MKLKTFNQKNLPVAPKGKPVVRLSLPSGLITFSPKAGEILNLTQHSHVELCQNEDVPSDWYLHVTNAPRIPNPSKGCQDRLQLQLHLGRQEILWRNKIRGESLFLSYITNSGGCRRRKVFLHFK